MTGKEPSSLAVIAAGIAGNTFSGIDQFCYEIYRGKKYSGNPRLLSLSDAVKSVFDQTDHLKAIQSLRLNVIVLNDRLTGQVSSHLPEANVISFTGSSLVNAVTKAESILREYEADLVVLVDTASPSDTVSMLALSTAKFADDHQIKPMGMLDVSPNYDREKTGLMVVGGELPEFVNHPASLRLTHDSGKSQSPTCALAGSASGLYSLLKLLTCLSNRIIPGNPGWEESDPQSIWAGSGFYAPGNSRSWFAPAGQEYLSGSVVSISDAHELAFLNLQTPCDAPSLEITMPQMESLCLFPFGGNSIEEISTQLETFKNTDFSRVNLQQAARFQYRRWQKNAPYAYTACVLGGSPEELLREIDYAVTGVPDAAGKSSDWRTPAGSTFSPDPLGNSGSIAFVYPGAFNSYPGVGQDLFRLFPPLYKRLAVISENIGELINERQLYPRRFARILPEDMERFEKELVADPLAMLISGTCLAAVYTFLLRETFDIHPQSSFGYSLGEISMMFASGVWTKADDTARALRQSPLFHNRLAGNQDAVRDYWKGHSNLPESSDGGLWANYVLMASYEKVAEAVKAFKHVYVTHINTPRQVVIGGQPDECRQLISTIKCSSLEAPFNYALHCEAMESEYKALRTLHSWPVQNQPGMTLYSASTNAPMPIDQDSIARQIAHGLTHRLDFPRLVETAYEGGARIFIELGAGSNCTRWVDESLAGKPHSAFSINRKGVDDHSAILQMLARLITHGIPVNLAPVFG
jgi:PfaB family protein